ncbi:type II secretion system protein GspJ [Propionivibrio dicarboxylicus]|uniref:Type II secretion system protein J n=1 Tax=Propionivibrio dicarboxylicus TaxID=83767 RepID=A0A1G8ANI2_9RHOO|nr:type II secretion system protein GspJ [Propionivibrio dicarboxylicus]SDH21840.1 N-terminal methylation site-containing protein [Propionivibrio dicarboxylicus]
MWRAKRTEHCHVGGFSLVELLVALTVFALASLIAYRGLNSMAATKAELDAEIRFWRALGNVFERMEMDFSLALAHPLRETPDRLGAPFQGASATEGFVIDLVRQDGDRTPVQLRYRCQNRTLTLSMRPVNVALTAAAATPVGGEQTTVLWQGIERCEAAFLGSAGVWRSDWPGGEAQSRPQGMRIRLAMPGHGQFERVYYLP